MTEQTNTTQQTNMTEQTDTNSASVLNVVIQADCPPESSSNEKCRNLFRGQVPSQFLLNTNISINIPLINGEIVQFQGQLVSIITLGNVECEYASGENFLKKNYPKETRSFQMLEKPSTFILFLIISGCFTFHLIFKIFSSFYLLYTI